MKIRGEREGQILITELLGEGECLISIDVSALKSMCARARMNKDRQANDGPVNVKFYKSRVAPLLEKGEVK